jgi:hypothetical protein
MRETANGRTGEACIRTAGSMSASLFFCSDFSGDELKRDDNQAARSSGRVKDYAAVSVPGIDSRLCLTRSHNGTSTTDDFGLHF